jgi:1,4-alpha-glucan branching enzyme
MSSLKRLDKAAVAATVAGDQADPFAVLGMHRGKDGGVSVRAFLPDAREVSVVAAANGSVALALDRIHDAGFFCGELPPPAEPFPYRLRVKWPEGESEAYDPYAFPPVLGELDAYLIAEGSHAEPYYRLGAHVRRIQDVDGVAFAVWAPNARRVSVVGPFNGWDGRRHAMRLRIESGVWEIFIPGLAPGELYKYEIKDRRGNLLPLKSDPYGFRAERPPSTASIVASFDGYEWRDGEWLRQRAARNAFDAPISIYEVHLGSWRRGADGRYLTYRDLAAELVPYVQELGFTHIELLPVSEHPFDGSWGYQPIGLFAPTSRFGAPDDFRHFVGACHEAGLAVLLDWVPGHFPNDAHGLAQFDGTALYEHADPRQGQHMDWGTLIYNYGRREVRNFLISNARFWIDRYHVDGLRVDAVASMLYLDYSRETGQWVPNVHGGNENLEAVDFLKRMNEAVFGHGVGATTAAEESTSWPMVSRPTYIGGLGFGFKWNMGWMHDTLGYISQDPVHRRYHQDKLTFGLLYAFSENFILPLSHDEVVHGKRSLLGRMPGDRWQRFANLRAYYGFMFAHPGKKLLFMGGEIAQESEWNHDGQLDWHLLQQAEHAGVRRLVGDLNRVYRDFPALHQLDGSAEGFEWIDCIDAENSVIAFLRRARDGSAFVIAVCNFTPVVRPGYRIGVPEAGNYREIINTDAEHYGGSGVGNPEPIEASSVECHGRPASLELKLPPLATVMLVRRD